MLPTSTPEMMSCPNVLMVFGSRQRHEMRGSSAGHLMTGARSALVPARHRHLDRLVRRKARREHLLVTILRPLPDTDRCTQILACVLRIIRPVEVGELDAAAVDERSLRQIELQRELSQLAGLIGFRLGQYLGEQRPDGGEAG